jgi:uncharacterized lipoprotein
MTHRIALIAMAAALLGLTGCKHLRTLGSACNKPKPYMTAQTTAPLKIPPGLDVPDTANALRVPALNAPTPPPRKKTDPCLDEPPRYTVPKQAPPQA